MLPLRADTLYYLTGMGKGRYLAMSVVFFAVGNFLGAYFTPAPELLLITAVLLAFLTFRFRDNVTIAFSMLALGALSIQVYRMPAVVHPSMLRLYAESLKHGFSNYLETIIPPGDELAIVKALAIGDKSDISREIMNDYKASGAIHLLALSGLHVGAIYKLMSITLKPLGGFRIFKVLKTIVILSAMWAFAMISGLSASISRAVIMITLYEISNYIHSDRDGLTVLSASAFFIMLINPESPREIGFQLSFVSMLSIFIILPRIKVLLAAKTRLLRYVWDTLAISISCQMTTGVISYLYFGAFPSYFMITNLISMPLITLIMYLIAGVLLTVKIPFIGDYLVSVLQYSIGLINKIMAIIGQL